MTVTLVGNHTSPDHMVSSPGSPAWGVGSSGHFWKNTYVANRTLRLREAKGKARSGPGGSGAPRCPEEAAAVPWRLTGPQVRGW